MKQGTTPTFSTGYNREVGAMVDPNEVGSIHSILSSAFGRNVADDVAGGIGSIHRQIEDEVLKGRMAPRASPMMEGPMPPAALRDGGLGSKRKTLREYFTDIATGEHDSR